jgi:hypothetical protein
LVIIGRLLLPSVVFPRDVLEVVPDLVFQLCATPSWAMS